MPPYGRRLGFEVTGEIKRPQSNLPTKLICLQRIRFDGGRMELRLGYYIIGKRPSMRGRWVWGQYAALMPIADFKAIVNQAKKLKWI
jgi:hypothetical protein